MDIVYKSRIFIVRFAKLFPFVLCTIVLISYTESLIALFTETYNAFGDSIVLHKWLSWNIAEYFCYDWYTILAATILSISMQTCWVNKAAIAYLSANILERDYFINIELYPEQIYPIVIANIIVCLFFLYNGIRILTKTI